MRTSVGRLVGATVDFNLFLEQNVNNFVTGKVARRTWKSNTPNVSTFKNHSAAQYAVLQAMDTNSMKPSEKFIIGGDLQSTGFKRYGAHVRMTADHLDSLSYMAEQSVGGPSLQSMIDDEFAKAGLQSYVLTSEALISEILQTEDYYDNPNIVSLTTPLDSATDLKEFITVIGEIITQIKLNAGGALKYKDNDATKLVEVGPSSPVKVVVPISVLNRLRAHSDLFNKYIPEGGMGNAGTLRLVDTTVIQQMFMDADCFTPLSITVDIADALYYEDANPAFVFDDTDAIYIYYNGSNLMGPQALVLHETELETEFDSEIFGREMKYMQKKAVELKQTNLMFKVKNLFSA